MMASSFVLRPGERRQAGQTYDGSGLQRRELLPIWLSYTGRLGLRSLVGWLEVRSLRSPPQTPAAATTIAMAVAIAKAAGAMR